VARKFGEARIFGERPTNPGWTIIERLASGAPSAWNASMKKAPPVLAGGALLFVERSKLIPSFDARR